jgi:hypothetical protein
LESELKMNFENNTDAVCITSDNGDALVPGTQALAVAQQEANTTGKPVTIRNPVTDEVLATIRPASRRAAASQGLCGSTASCRAGIAMRASAGDGDAVALT